MRWINLEPIIQTEVSQKEKDTRCVLTHIYTEFRKIAQDPAFRPAKETQT